MLHYFLGKGLVPGEEVLSTVVQEECFFESFFDIIDNFSSGFSLVGHLIDVP